MNKASKAHSIFSFLLALSCFVCAPLYASYENSTQLGVKKEETTFSLFNSLSYSVSSDALDNNNQKVFNQGISYGGTLFIKQKYYFTLGVAATYHSVENAIQQDDNGSVHLSDVSVGFGTKAIRLYKGNSDSVSLFTNIRNVFPLSERSRNEGYKSVPSGAADLAYQTGRLGIVLSGQYAYVMNSFETNLAGSPNLESSASTGLTVRYNYWRLRAQFSYRLGVLTYLDGSQIGNSGNSFSLMASMTRSWWLGLSTSNFNNVDEQFVDVWFYDPYTRFYRISTGVTF